MRNKVMGWYDPAGNAASDVSSMGLNRSGLDSYYFVGIQCNGSYSSLPTTSQINSAAANFPSGLGLDLYLSDELNGCSGDYNAIRTVGANAHAANRKRQDNGNSQRGGPKSVRRCGSLGASQLRATVARLPFTGGGDLWSYTSCNAGYGNAPEWMVDYPPINERIQAGFLNFTQGANRSSLLSR